MWETFNGQNGRTLILPALFLPDHCQWASYGSVSCVTSALVNQWCVLKWILQIPMLNYADPSCVNDTARLVGDGPLATGQVQLCYNQSWTSISGAIGSQFTLQVAAVICRQLGFSDIGTVRRISVIRSPLCLEQWKVQMVKRERLFFG